LPGWPTIRQDPLLGDPEAGRANGNGPPVARVRVDYSRWLRSPIVEIALPAGERAPLRVGDPLAASNRELIGR
jgi:hypothetical protein